MPQKIINIKILPGCVSCGACEATCPEVFEVSGIVQIKANSDLSKNEDLIKEAADICPVNTIKIEYEQKQ